MDGNLLPLKSGPFYLAKESEAPISPVYIYGAFDLMTKGQIVPNQKGVVIVEYQKTIETRGKSHEELKVEVENRLEKNVLPILVHGFC
jgi:1-acyl-sn-glycerol-3-phosphate acyltransferase